MSLTIKNLIFFILFFNKINAQIISCKVLDIDDNKPLAYATIIYGKEKIITLSNKDGFFYLKKLILESSDSFVLEFIGYKSLKIHSNIKSNAQFFLQKKADELEAVIVNTCKELKEYDFSFRLRSFNKMYVGGNTIRATYFENTKNHNGYLKTISIMVKQFHESDSCNPIRLHWYSFDKGKNMIDKELTNSSLIFYPTKNKLNTFNIPDNAIYFGKQGLILGIEFITPENIQNLDEDLTNKEIGNWKFLNSWFINYSYCDKPISFLSYDNSKSFVSATDENRFIKFLFNFSINECKN